MLFQRVTFYLVGLALIGLAACVPARTPPQLAATPGAAVVVDGQMYQTAVFSARYPDGWRAIASPAGEPPFVTFAAPDNCTLILLSLDARPAPESNGCAGAVWREASETVDGAPVIFAALRAPADQWAEAEAAFAAVVASVRTLPEAAS